MPTVSCGFDGSPDRLALHGPTLSVDIGFDPTFAPGVGLRPRLAHTDMPALVDTGAAITCIDSSLARELDLPVVNQRSVSGAHGRAALNMHLAQVHIPSLGIVIYGEFAGAHLTAGGQPHFALIGRNILRRLRMTYDGTTGSVTLESP